jgi:hypothetical protein
LVGDSLAEADAVGSGNPVRLGNAVGSGDPVELRDAVGTEYPVGTGDSVGLRDAVEPGVAGGECETVAVPASGDIEGVPLIRGEEENVGEKLGNGETEGVSVLDGDREGVWERVAVEEMEGVLVRGEVRAIVGSGVGSGDRVIDCLFVALLGLLSDLDEVGAGELVFVRVLTYVRVGGGDRVSVGVVIRSK